MASQGRQLKMPMEALCSAFNHQTLEELLRFELDQRLDQFAPQGDMKRLSSVSSIRRNGKACSIGSSQLQPGPTRGIVHSKCT
jgi:hypothetical protein